MASLPGHTWKDKRLTKATKIRLYQALVLSVLMYAADTWTLLAVETQALEVFHVRYQRQILGVRWFDFTRDDEIALRTGLLPITDLTRSKKAGVHYFLTSPVCQRHMIAHDFGHVTSKSMSICTLVSLDCLSRCLYATLLRYVSLRSAIKADPMKYPQYFLLAGLISVPFHSSNVL